jgi:hypothetical protein
MDEQKPAAAPTPPPPKKTAADDGWKPAGVTNEKAVQWALNTIQKTISAGNEIAISMREDGTKPKAVKGKEGAVTLSNEFIGGIDSQPENSVILMHSHLKEIGFSLDDVQRLFEHPAIKELRVIDKAGTMYILPRSALNRWLRQSNDIKEAANLFNKERTKKLAELNLSYKDERIIRRLLNQAMFGPAYTEAVILKNQKDYPKESVMKNAQGEEWECPMPEDFATEEEYDKAYGEYFEAWFESGEGDMTGLGGPVFDPGPEPMPWEFETEEEFFKAHDVYFQKILEDMSRNERRRLEREQQKHEKEG